MILSGFTIRNQQAAGSVPAGGSRPESIMRIGREAPSPERGLCDLLDALEAGLLRLRGERDELRETAGKVKAGKAKPKKAAPKKKAAARKAAPKKAVKQAPVAETAEPEKRPKPPSKTRQALGRTLLQIRPRREPGV